MASEKTFEHTPDYTFTEPVHSRSNRWHIRELTDEGQQLISGADTPSLCGLRMYRDLTVELTDLHLAHSCPVCAAKYMEIA